MRVITNEGNKLHMKIKIMFDSDLKGKQDPITPLFNMVTRYAHC
jgi:uncharacterized protein YoxC